MKRYTFKLSTGIPDSVNASSLNRALVALKQKHNNELVARQAKLLTITK